MSVVSPNQAVELLKKGKPVALPTETVYGLAAPIDQASALESVFRLKGRPLSDPLIVHVSSLDMAARVFKNFNQDLKKLASAFWPGPLTLVSQKNCTLVPDLITAGFETVAVRMPRSQIFLDVIEAVGSPLAAPSANLFKKVSPTSAEHILQTLPGVPVVDGGSSDVGIESTIYDLASKTILRPGDITHEQIEAVLKSSVTYTEKDFTPGSEKEHYRPDTPVVVFENLEQLKTELVLKKNAVQITLGDDAKKAAQTFYNDLREKDQLGCTQIYIFFDPKWTDVSWLGLKNRLIKTASKWIEHEK